MDHLIADGWLAGWLLWSLLASWTNQRWDFEMVLPVEPLELFPGAYLTVQLMQQVSEGMDRVDEAFSLLEGEGKGGWHHMAAPRD